MSNTKIVIDKEDWDKIASEFNSNDLPTVTEIQIDQSIEEKIKSILNKYEPINKGTEYFYNSNSVIESMQEIATSQQIIEQLRVKEKELILFAKYLLPNGYTDLALSNIVKTFLEETK